MPKLSGLFDSFDNLDQIDINCLILWLKNPPAPTQLENYLANKILYPNTIPQKEADMKIDLAILREALRINSPKKRPMLNPLLGDNPFLNMTLRKIVIPGRFLQYVPDLTSITWAFVDGLLLNRRKEDWFEDLWTVVISADTEEVVGSVILPQFNASLGNIDIFTPGTKYQIEAGSLTVIPCEKSRCEIAYKSDTGRILGKNINSIEVCGGRLGLMIDGRMQ